ncbi:EamA family transporter RarD [Microbacterium sediminicola]|uniref:EamA family transporter RarD n=1 Tax=Microbacterium sediminicola TaxID=415210 RepID=A0ABP4TGH5_9MICO
MTQNSPDAAPAASTPADPARERAIGGVYTFVAYLLWGFLPLYFVLLAPTGPFELVGWRIFLSLVFCVLLLTVTRGWKPLIAIIRRPRLLLLTGLAGAFIYINWQVFIVAALSGHVIETSLGYFINPIATVILAVVVLHERLRVAQWVAIGIAAAAVVVIVVGYGAFPWIALTLAGSFATYGLIKKRIGPSVDALSGLTLESAWLTPVALVLLVVTGAAGSFTYGQVSPWHTVLLTLAGAVTAIPLLFFAAGTRRVPLSVVGLLQFVAPILQFLSGILILGEPMPAERWIGFSLVWVALIVLTVDSLAAARRSRRAGKDAVPGVSDVAELT